MSTKSPKHHWHMVYIYFPCGTCLFVYIYHIIILFQWNGSNIWQVKNIFYAIVVHLCCERIVYYDGLRCNYVFDVASTAAKFFVWDFITSEALLPEWIWIKCTIIKLKHFLFEILCRVRHSCQSEYYEKKCTILKLKHFLFNFCAEWGILARVNMNE